MTVSNCAASNSLPNFCMNLSGWYLLESCLYNLSFMPDLNHPAGGSGTFCSVSCSFFAARSSKLLHLTASAGQSTCIIPIFPRRPASLSAIDVPDGGALLPLFWGTSLGGSFPPTGDSLAGLVGSGTLHLLARAVEALLLVENLLGAS